MSASCRTCPPSSLPRPVQGGPGGVLPSLPHGPGEGPLGHHAQLPQPDEVAQAEVGGGGEGQLDHPVHQEQAGGWAWQDPVGCPVQS